MWIKVYAKLKGLAQCKWPGRNQIIESSNGCTYYLDGAHTVESMQQFVEWFLKQKPVQNDDEKNVLLFNYTGERDPSKFLETLMVRIIFKSIFFITLIFFQI